MSYTPTSWIDGETPVNAENMNKLEQAVQANDTAIKEINTARDNGEFVGAQGPQGEPGVYTLAEGETIEDAPSWAKVVIDPNGEEELGQPYLDYIDKELAKRGQLKPEFANSVAELEESGDTTKLYVLPDGYIYAYMSSTNNIEIETTAGGYYNTDGEWVEDSQATAQRTNLIPVTEGEQFQYTGYAKWQASVIWFNEAKTKLSSETYGISVTEPDTVTVTAPAGAAYVRFYSYSYGQTFLSVTPLNDSNSWQSTGHAFVPADYEDRIVALEEKTDKLENGVTEPLKGKKLVYDGDSIAESRTNNGGGYARIIADMTGGTYINQAVGGGRLTTATGDATYHSVVDNLPNLPKDGDLYCFEGGINDYWTPKSLGTLSKTDYTGELDINTVCGALETIFRYALTEFVGKPICFVITHKIQNSSYFENANGDTFEDYRNAMVGICEKYSIPYYDAFYESGLNGWNTAQNDAFLTSNADGTADGCHPNADGYKRYYVPQLLNLFRRIMPV